MARFPDLAEFTAACADACNRAPTPEQNGPNALVMTDDDEDGLLVYGVAVGADPDRMMEQIKQLMAGRHDFAAMATTVRWSPDENPFFDAWCVVTVQRDQQARVSIIKMGERAWWDVPMTDAPWFALATASACRGWLDGKFTAVKKVPSGDRRLFNKPLDGNPVPPEDTFGRI